MSLESKVLRWVDLGQAPYQDVYEYSQELHKLRCDDDIDDVLLRVEHPVEVNFGSMERDNAFSEALRDEVKDHVRGEVTEGDIVAYLAERGVRFSRMKRGGGATVLAPGQFFYHPIVDVADAVGKELTAQDMTAIGEYKNGVDTVMLRSLEDLGVTGLNTVQTGYNEEIEREWRDVWLEERGRSYKLGSKGIVVRQGVSYNGFSLYATRSGVEPFKYVKPCGYDHEDLSVSSVEEVTGKAPDPAVVDDVVKENVKAVFGYDAVLPVDAQHVSK